MARPPVSFINFIYYNNSVKYTSLRNDVKNKLPID